MQYFYDGQIRRYLIQIIRLLSNFVVKYGDGTLVRIPVMYGDIDRQVASIVNQNSENTLQSCPRIAVYINDLQLDRTRLSDPYFISKVHIRERGIDSDTGEYTSTQGGNYTVERLMPTPFTLKVKIDIWSANTDQKLQILEQILVLFNPSLEIQTTDNYIDWTSLTVVELNDVMFSSRQIPVGTNSAIDIATLTLVAPIYLSPPVKVKKLGVVTKIIASVYGAISEGDGNYLDGWGNDPAGDERVPSNFLYTQVITAGAFDITVVENRVYLHSNQAGASNDLSWKLAVEQTPGTFTAGLSKIFLIQDDGSEVIGTLSYHPLDDTIMVAEWDTDSFPSNDYIDNSGLINGIDLGYNSATGKGTFDAVIDPTTFNPKRPNGETVDQTITTGIRYLLVDNVGGGVRDTFTTTVKTKKISTGVNYDDVYEAEIYVNGVEVAQDTALNNAGIYVIVTTATIPIGSVVTYSINLNDDGPDAWKNADSTDPTAYTNDIVMWDGTKWQTIFASSEKTDVIVYQTNYYTGTQYKWNGVTWVKSFEGDYKKDQWRMSL